MGGREHVQERSRGLSRRRGGTRGRLDHRGATPRAWWSKGVYAWTDLQPNTAGLVVYEEDVLTGQARVTYDGVPGWNTPDPCYIQIDYNVLTGDWAIRFGTVGFANPEDWLVGYSPGGASLDPGPTDISTAQVIVTQAGDLAPPGE